MKTERNKLTNLFKIGTLLLGLSLLLLNCKKEEILIEDDPSHYGIEAEYSKEIISFSSFKSSNKTYDLFFTKLETNKTLSKKTQEYTNFNYITAIDKSEVISFIGKDKKHLLFL